MLPKLFNAFGAFKPPKLGTGKTQLRQLDQTQTEFAKLLALPKTVPATDLSQSTSQVKLSDAMTMLKAILVAMFSNLLTALAQPASFRPPESLIRQGDNAAIQQPADEVKTEA